MTTKMVLKLLIIATLFSISFGQRTNHKEHRYACSERSALLLLKRPAFEFSMNILDSVAQNEAGHFVFSPLSTWLQLSALAEGAKGRTFRELWNITRHHRNKCFKLKLRRLLRNQMTELSEEYRQKSVIVTDKFINVKKQYVRDVQKFYGVKVLLKNFDYPETSANEVNRYIKSGMNGVIGESVYADDFNKETMSLLLSDNVLFRSAWKFPFSSAFTQIESFKSSDGAYLGDVNMMSLTAYLNTTEMRFINAKVVEIPCIGDFSMLVFIPILNNTWVGDTFYNLKRTTLTSIFNRFKSEGQKLVNIKLPRFRINSTVDNLVELLVDMGLKNVFNPNLAELTHISDYNLYASLITQLADIEVVEQGVRASASADSLVKVNDTSDQINFIANRPFAYMIVERKTNFILFAGTYSVPSVY